jgi:phosphoribosyl-ATP pyrophosphohydrolase
MAAAAAGPAELAARRAELVGEPADLLYHWLVLLMASGVGLEEVAAGLVRRASGREASPAAEEPR